MARDNDIVETFVDVAKSAMVPAAKIRQTSDTALALVKVIEILNELKPDEVQRILRAAGSYFGYDDEVL